MNTKRNQELGLKREESTRVRKNGTHRFTGKDRYRIYADHQDRDTQVKMSLNNGRYVADGKLEGGWCISVLDETGTRETFKDFEDAKKLFEELSHGTPPEPEFDSKQY